MEKRLTIWVVVIAAILVLTIVILNVSQPTGNITFTSGASYGTTIRDGYDYKDCAYITEDDGWDATKKETIQYYDTREKKVATISDACVDSIRLMEYDCEDNYLVRREVVCPSDMVCKEGICTSNE